MLPEFFTSDIFFGFIIGSVIGMLAYRQYVIRTKYDSIGNRLENIMLSQKVEEVLNLSQELNNLVQKIQNESIELSEQIHLVRDIESLPRSIENNNDAKDDISSLFTLEDNDSNNSGNE